MDKFWETGWSTILGSEPDNLFVNEGPGQILGNWQLSPDQARQFDNEITVMRMIGSTVIRQPGTFFQGTVHVGAIVTADPAVVPSPLYDGWMDWLFIDSITANAGSFSYGGTSYQSNEHMFDVRSRRKIERGEGLLWVWHFDDGNEGTMYLKDHVRVLYAVK